MLRLACNRDELRSRARALPPTLVELDGLRVLMPVDPVSRGTWIACNEAGLAIALLNVNPPDLPAIQSPRSRGDIVPRLARFHSLEQAAEAALAIDARAYAPFRLVCASRGLALEIVPSTGSVQRLSLNTPLMFTSSGLGDHQVETPRRELFARTVVAGSSPELAIRQDQFHAHRWRDRPHLSVCMTRADACTVSRTVIEIREDRLTMNYAAEPEWKRVTIETARASTGQRADNSR